MLAGIITELWKKNENVLQPSDVSKKNQTSMTVASKNNPKYPR